MRPSFFHHLHPPTIPERQARFGYTLGAGGAAVLLTLIVGGTGILEMFYYVPTPDEAALSVQTITYLVPYGSIVRGLHYWSGQLLLAVVGVHLLRVMFTGAYAGRRRSNHILGMALLVLGIFLDFTGYMLRWDQGIQWALVAGTNLVRTIPIMGAALVALVAGAAEVGNPTLIRLYAWHIFGLSLPFAIVGVWHVFRVRRDGGIAVPPPSLRADHKRISRSVLVRRELLAALLIGTALLLLAAFAPAPIAAPITDVKAFASEARAPWFLLWVQQMLRWGDPFLFGILVPLAIVVGLSVPPYVFRGPAPAELGQWFPASDRAPQILTTVIVLAVAVVSILGLLPQK